MFVCYCFIYLAWFFVFFALEAEFLVVVFSFGADFVSLQSIILLMSLRRVSNFSLFFGFIVAWCNVASYLSTVTHLIRCIYCCFIVCDVGFMLVQAMRYRPRLFIFLLLFCMITLDAVFICFYSRRKFCFF